MKTLMNKTLRDMSISLGNICSIVSENIFACMFKWSIWRPVLHLCVLEGQRWSWIGDNLTAFILRTFPQIQEKKEDEKYNQLET